ncbi:MAG: helix-turn-helix domain-containing protein [Bacteroidaceae bacterium]|nr:helix-turn-helix domain-containing protein [Bacteroidales bacterium]MCF0203236.1 helix-turn-helix domain-containing protein [Bacteroidaceae bacterium]
MENINMLSDTEITKKISAKLKELRLKQNISRQEMSASSGVSMSSVVRMEDGEIKSFESFLRILRTLGRIDVLLPLVEEEEISPNEYFKLVHSTKTKQRKRASKSSTNSQQEESEW